MAQRRKPVDMTVAKEYREAVAFIETISPGWQEVMGLDHIEIKHHYLDAGSDQMFGGNRPKNSPNVVRCAYGHDTTYTAFVETRWNYQMADVYWMCPSIIRWDEKRLTATVVHEYSHIALAPEQYLLDMKIEDVWSAEALQQGDLDTLAALYYERMEMATENMARSVLRAAGAD